MLPRASILSQQTLSAPEWLLTAFCWQLEAEKQRRAAERRRRRTEQLALLGDAKRQAKIARAKEMKLKHQEEAAEAAEAAAREQERRAQREEVERKKRSAAHKKKAEVRALPAHGTLAAVFVVTAAEYA